MKEGLPHNCLHISDVFFCAAFKLVFTLTVGEGILYSFLRWWVCCMQERAELVLLRYSSRWVKQIVRRRLDLSVDVSERTGASFPPPPPRHCATSRCPCQFIEEHLKYKPRGKLTLRQFFYLPDFWYSFIIPLCFFKGLWSQINMFKSRLLKIL